MKPLPELYDEHVEREAEKFCRDIVRCESPSVEDDCFKAGANSVKPLIMELAKALKAECCCTGELNWETCDPILCDPCEALQKLRKELGG